MKPQPKPEPSAAAVSPQGDKAEIDLDKDKLFDAMERSGWVQAKAARILGVTPRQIGYALRKQGIALKKF